MLQDTKRDLISQARRLNKPYEEYSIDELADAYCSAVDTADEISKNIYISALILRFWYTIDKSFKQNTVAPCLEREDFFWWLYEAIEYACKYRGWQNKEKKLNAQQCINQCIETIKLQKYYELRLDKRKVVNNCCSIDTPIDGDGENSKTIGDLLESEENFEDYIYGDATAIIQGYINKNKILEAILLDNIAYNDTQKHFKKVIKTQNDKGDIVRYTEHSSQFWSFKLVQIVSQLPSTYKTYFLNRYNIAEEKLSAVLGVINKANNQKLYRYLSRTLNELKELYA